MTSQPPKVYRLVVAAAARRKIKLIPREHQEAVVFALTEVRENPFAGKALTRELTGRFSFRIGVYRLVYKVDQKDKVIQVINVGHRANVYKPVLKRN